MHSMRIEVYHSFDGKAYYTIRSVYRLIESCLQIHNFKDIEKFLKSFGAIKVDDLGYAFPKKEDCLKLAETLSKLSAYVKPKVCEKGHTRDSDNYEPGESMNCAVCHEHIGWYCENMDSMFCEYDAIKDPQKKSCIHCGKPFKR